MSHILGRLEVDFETRVAAVMAEQNPKQMRQELTRVLHLSPGGLGHRHRFGFREILYFRLKSALEAQGTQLSQEDRQALFTLLTTRSREQGCWSRSGSHLSRRGPVPMTLDLSGIARAIQTAVRELIAGQKLLESRPDVLSGVPVFKGTRVPLAQVVGQFRAGVSRLEIAEDYPHLTEEALSYAARQAALSPGPGRPPSAPIWKRCSVTHER